MTSATLARVFAPLAALGMGAAVWFAAAAPVAQLEGIVQKIMYVHVPTVWTAYLAFFVGFVSSIGFLATKRRSWDRVALASIEVGVLFCTLVLVTGPIWARPAWGVWWVWDARLTATLVLWFMYVGVLVVRTMASDRAQAARWSAVVAIVSFLDVPIVHYSVKWWRTLHPLPKALTDGKLNAGLEPEMATALWVGVLGFTLLYLALFFVRLSIEKVSDEMEERIGVESAGESVATGERVA